MSDLKKYQGIFPAFYACYDDNGEVCKERTKQLTEHFINKKVTGLYIGGSSGECIYQSVEERKIILEEVMKVAKGKLIIIAHVACGSTKESMELAKHAEDLGVDAISAIPPIYYKVSDNSVIEYWNDISSAAPNTDFIIYNIPQLTGVNVTKDMYLKLIENKKVIGIKNTSMPAVDMQVFKSVGEDAQVIFNGPDEQYLAGRVMGADGGIGGTYGVMPELFLKLDQLIKDNDIKTATILQKEINNIIFDLCSTGSLYSIAKGVLKMQGLNVGGVRKPLQNLRPEDNAVVERCHSNINTLLSKYK